MIKGLDVGYAYTKDNEKRIFRSAITQVDKIVSGAIKITIDGTTYYVGTGRGTVAVDKTDSELAKVCMLTNLAMSTGNEFYIVTGLPIAQFKDQKEKLREALLKYRKSRVEIGGAPKEITIHDVTIFPQAIGALYSQSIRDDALIIDIGGRTVDVAFLEYDNHQFSLQKSDTWYKGMLCLYSNVIDEINRKFNLTLEPQNAERILVKGLELFGKQQDLSFLKNVIEEHIAPIVDEITLNYPASTTRMYLCGGGANLMAGVFRKHFPHLEVMPDCQFANAIGFYKVGLQIYGKKEERIVSWQRNV